jgi:hypothetical protein
MTALATGNAGATAGSPDCAGAAAATADAAGSSASAVVKLRMHVAARAATRGAKRKDMLRL